MPFLSPGDLPDPGIESGSPTLKADTLPSEPPGRSGLFEKSFRFGHIFLLLSRASLVAQRLKCLPARRETWVQSLGREDPLEKEMATHSSILAWRIPWTEEPGGLQSTGSQNWT